LPDLIISSATVTMTCEPDGSRTAKFVATVKNQSSVGTVNLSAIPWQQIIAADWWPPQYKIKDQPLGTVKPMQGGPMMLKPGEEFTTPLTMTGLPSLELTEPGNTEYYGFELTADPLGGVFEADEDNSQKLLYVALDKNCVAK
jgi:hypothetical protein